MTKLKKYINDSFLAKNSLLKKETKITEAIKQISTSIKKGGTIFFCGNGGSAADAQHLTAELLVRLRPHINRNPISAISLLQDTSTITACSNDYKFEELFSRNLEAFSKIKGRDILVCISTSGNSKNILKVLKTAKKKGVFSISFLGSGGGKAKKLSDLPIIVNSKITARIQEAHIFLGHYILEEVEDSLI
jgi:D-sedoheptulose 7-phosphate isomerase